MKMTIEVDVEFGISIFDLIYELQDLADKFGDLLVWSCQDLAFKTRDKNEGEDSLIKVEQLQEQNTGLSQKVHILNEANEKNYNALCDEIKKNNKLQEQLKKAIKNMEKRPKGTVTCFIEGEMFDINYDYDPPRIYKDGKFIGTGFVGGLGFIGEVKQNV